MTIVTDPAHITPQWLTEQLHVHGCLDKSVSVAGVRWEIIGTGKMGDNARFLLDYDRTCDAPASVIAKLPAADETARGMAAYTGAYRKEVMFYRDLAGFAAIDTPVIYTAQLDKTTNAEFIILMEDLAPAEPGDQLQGETLAHARRALAEVAKLHGAFSRQSELLQADYITHNDPDGAAFGQQLLEQNWGGFVDRFGHGLSAECIAFGEEYVGRHATWATGYRGKPTLVHGDFRAENLLFNPAGRTTTVDWQTLSASCGLADVAYFIGGSLALSMRREAEKSLVEHYRACLAANGEELSAAECWGQYREFSMHGILITVLGAMFSGADPRGDRMFLSMAQRHLQQCVDVHAAEFLR
jgi:hypothetical protein